jgi:hypothetical protein
MHITLIEHIQKASKNVVQQEVTGEYREHVADTSSMYTFGQWARRKKKKSNGTL